MRRRGVRLPGQEIPDLVERPKPPEPPPPEPPEPPRLFSPALRRMLAEAETQEEDPENWRWSEGKDDPTVET